MESKTRKGGIIAATALAVVGGTVAIASPLAVLLNQNTYKFDSINAANAQAVQSQITNNFDKVFNSEMDKNIVNNLLNGGKLNPTLNTEFVDKIAQLGSPYLTPENIKDITVSNVQRPAGQNMTADITINAGNQTILIPNVNTGIVTPTDTDNLINTVKFNFNYVVTDATADKIATTEGMKAAIVEASSGILKSPADVTNVSITKIAYAEEEAKLIRVPIQKLNINFTANVNNAPITGDFQNFVSALTDNEEIWSRFVYDESITPVDHSKILGVSPKGQKLPTLWIPEDAVSFEAASDSNFDYEAEVKKPEKVAAAKANQNFIIDFTFAKNFKSLFLNKNVENKGPNLRYASLYHFPAAKEFKMSGLQNVREIPSWLGYHIPNLAVIDLSHMPNLHTLPLGTAYFRGTVINDYPYPNGQSPLKRFELKGTNITNFEGISFNGNHQLESIDLSGTTSLELLGDITFKNNKNLKLINLENLETASFPIPEDGIRSFVDNPVAKIRVKSQEVADRINLAVSKLPSKPQIKPQFEIVGKQSTTSKTLTANPFFSKTLFSSKEER